MQKAAPYLFFAARGLAICAALAGVGAGILTFMFSGFICFDSCITRSALFADFGQHAVDLMTPCAVLEALALATFLTYSLATHQARRAVISVVFLLVVGLVAVVALSAYIQYAQDTLPIWGGEEGDLLVESSAVAWAAQWGLILALVAGVWTGVPALLQWRRGVTQPLRMADDAPDR